MKKHLALIISLILISITIILLTYIYTSSQVLFSPDSPSTQEKEITLTLNTDGTSSEKILWRINVLDILSTIPQGKWGIEIPKTAKQITITDPNGNLAFEIEERENNNFLTFENSKNINYNQNYFFEINYKVNKNPILIEPFYFYKRTFTRFETDNKFTLTLLPPPSSIENTPITYEFEKPETKTIDLTLTTSNTNPNLETINTEHYTTTIPSRYAEEYLSILEKADQGVSFIEQTYGFLSPHKWNIEIINHNDPDFEEQTEGFYLGEGRIRIKATHLSKTEKEILYIILHETVHGFNSKYFPDEIPNFWWEEGTAQYISYQTLEHLDYNTETLKQKNLQLSSSCQNQDLSFINEWSPNIYLSAPEEEQKTINCQDIQTSPIELGYAQSYNIVKTLADQDPALFRKFHSKLRELKIKFSPNKNTLNNQMNFLLTETLNQETTQTLNSLGLNVNPIPDNEDYKTRILTGMPTFEPLSKTPKQTFAIILTMIIIGAIIFYILKNENYHKLSLN
ncbi:MAG: hypothetical protein ABIG28_01245 [archaeon]